MNELETVLFFYKTLKDSLQTTKNALSLRQEDPTIFERTSFSHEKKEDIKNLLQSASSELEEIIVLKIYATFEKIFFQKISDRLQHLEDDKKDPFQKNLSSYAKKNYEYWKIEDLLNLFKEEIPSVLLGDLKNIYAYRNWLAHGKKRRFRKGELEEPPPCTPEDACKKLASFLAQIEPLPPSPPGS